MSERTPGPWRALGPFLAGVCTVDGFNPERVTPYQIGSIEIKSGSEERPTPICSISWNAYSASAEANAAFIVKAVNHHDALVAALRGLMPYYPPQPTEPDAFKRARAVLATVERVDNE